MVHPPTDAEGAILTMLPGYTEVIQRRRVCSGPSTDKRGDALRSVHWQVVQVCAEHKKPKKLLKHMASIKALSAGQRNPPRTLIFANRVSLQLLWHALTLCICMRGWLCMSPRTACCEVVLGIRNWRCNFWPRRPWRE